MNHETLHWLRGTAVNILVAYPYMTAKMRQAIEESGNEFPINLLVDSGAFSAYNSGKEITLDAYCSFISTLPQTVSYAQLDVIGNESHSMENLKTMVGRGLHPLPIFTRGSDPDQLSRLREYGDYVMLGGVAQGAERKEYVNWFSKLNAGRPIHWLGFVETEFIRVYRPTSVDSSSWTGAARFGNLPLYIGGGKFKALTRSDARDFAVRRLLREHGLSELEVTSLLTDPVAWRNTPSAGGRLALRVSAAAHLLRAADIERNFGTKCYLAVTGADQIETICAALRGLLL